MQTDYVARGCIANTEGCTLIHKCNECKIEINNLTEIDDMYIEYFKQLEYLKNKLDSKKDEAS